MFAVEDTNLLLLLARGTFVAAPRLRHGTWSEPAALCGRTAPPCRGAWLGGLLPPLILVRDALPKPAAETLRRFSRLATLCAIAIAGTACSQGWVLGGGVAGLI